MKCKKHPDYKAIHAPRGKCQTCWAIYQAKNQKPGEGWDDTIE